MSSPLNQAGNVRGRVVAVAQEGDSYIDSYSRNKQVLYDAEYQFVLAAEQAERTAHVDIDSIDVQIIRTLVGIELEAIAAGLVGKAVVDADIYRTFILR